MAPIAAIPITWGRTTGWCCRYERHNNYMVQNTHSKSIDFLPENAGTVLFQWLIADDGEGKRVKNSDCKAFCYNI